MPFTKRYTKGVRESALDMVLAYLWSYRSIRWSISGEQWPTLRRPPCVLARIYGTRLVCISQARKSRSFIWNIVSTFKLRGAITRLDGSCFEYDTWQKKLKNINEDIYLGRRVTASGRMVATVTACISKDWGMYSWNEKNPFAHLSQIPPAVYHDLPFSHPFRSTVCPAQKGKEAIGVNLLFNCVNDNDDRSLGPGTLLIIDNRALDGAARQHFCGLKPGTVSGRGQLRLQLLSVKNFYGIKFLNDNDQKSK